MCILFIALHSHDRYPLIIAANRDEFYERPTAAAAFWNDRPDVLAGRDLKEGGTWLGITKTGRIAAVTNFRNPRALKEAAPSRGRLVSAYLCGDERAPQFIEHLRGEAERFNGFNILLGDHKGLWHYSNVGGDAVRLPGGFHGISNHLLNTPWPKVERVRTRLGTLIKESDEPSPDDIFEVLADTSRPDDSMLPDTGVGIEWERILSPLFVASPQYGTRSSTCIFIDAKGAARFIERVYSGAPSRAAARAFEFTIERTGNA
jgi:uncharacterized protein with NRDE domain